MSTKIEAQKTDFDTLVEYQNKGAVSSLAIECSDLAIKAGTLDGMITLWNHGAENMYGYRGTEMIGRNESILIPLDQINDHGELIKQTAEGHSIINYETKRIRKDGVIIDISLTLSLIKDETGKIIGIATLDRDITEVLLNKKELIFQNDEKEKRSNELIIANKELAFQNDEKEKRADELFIAKKELIFQGKEKEKAEVANKELQTQGKALKLASQYSRSIIEASRDPLFAINAAGKIIDVNEATINATDKARENIIGTDFIDYFTDKEKAQDAYQLIFKNGFITDYSLTIIDGILTDVFCNGSIHKDDKGIVLGAVIVARDVTEQKKIETALTEAIVFAEVATGIAEVAKVKAENATGIAEGAMKAKQQFLSNMSHEIRTPMNAIIGFTKVLLKTNLSEKQKEYLQAIKLSGDALIVLINDILDLAKVDSGKMTFEQVPFKMASSISAMLHLFEPKIQEKNLKLIKEYDNNIPEVLLGDPVRLHQVILNLVSNAVKFTTKGKITVSVHMLCEDEKSVIIQFSVTDTGIGIPEDKIQKIFDNFQQASSGTSRLYGGTGLGLAIVKQLVEAQEGTIHVNSKIDEGSTFSIILSFQKLK